ncbi:MAG: hypothetical protein AB1Z31_28300, partial [Desulfobacterales bacterium]
DLLNFQIKGKLSAPFRIRAVTGTQPGAQEGPGYVCYFSNRAYFIVFLAFAKCIVCLITKCGWILPI